MRYFRWKFHECFAQVLREKKNDDDVLFIRIYFCENCDVQGHARKMLIIIIFKLKKSRSRYKSRPETLEFFEAFASSDFYDFRDYVCGSYTNIFGGGKSLQEWEEAFSALGGGGGLCLTLFLFYSHSLSTLGAYTTDTPRKTLCAVGSSAPFVYLRSHTRTTSDKKALLFVQGKHRSIFPKLVKNFNNEKVIVG